MVPAYNEQESLPLLYAAVAEAMSAESLAAYDWELLLINDGSKDDTLNIMKELRANDNRVCYVDLSRNFGKEKAMLAGFDFVTGDCCVVMDADLQDPPCIIADMVAKWEEGYDDVYAKRTFRGKESWLKKKLSLSFYKMLNSMSKVEMLENVGDFRLLDKKCVESLKKIRESERYTKGLFCWIGYRKCEISFERSDRVAGSTSWNMRSLTKLAIDGIVSFTTAPLHIAIWAGLAVSVLAFLYMIFIFVRTLFFGDPVAGFPTLICVILLLGGVQLLCIGIMGEYVAKIYNEVKGRPVYIAREYNGDIL